VAEQDESTSVLSGAGESRNPWGSAALECDVVMEGGTTSGVVYALWSRWRGDTAFGASVVPVEPHRYDVHARDRIPRQRGGSERQPAQVVIAWPSSTRLPLLSIVTEQVIPG